MAGQRPQLTVERLGKKGPASDRIVGFCSLPKFCSTGRVAVADGRVGGSRQGEGDGRQMKALACSEMSSWDLIVCLFLKRTLMKRWGKKKSSRLTASIFIATFLNRLLQNSSLRCCLSFFET